MSPERGTGLHAWYVRNGIYGAIAEMRVHNARIARVIEMFQFFEGQQSSLLAQIGRNIPIFEGNKHVGSRIIYAVDR